MQSANAHSKQNHNAKKEIREMREKDIMGEKMKEQIEEKRESERERERRRRKDDENIL